ncbi:SAM-dependent methyltransferase [Amycolatopsis keratiniphila]|uniref:SAM-dependent methyltransferase n=1 Tax=Amycolatopsis keratiniphila TaxID=129921 RepID=UPI0013015C43|nr:SAM-dependent methyltransferase [Amycolatopsis keratiniphila]
MTSGAAVPRLMPSDHLARQEAYSRARFIDALVGGKDNYALDRELAGKIRRALPDGAHAAGRLFGEDRRFQLRVCEMLLRRTPVTTFVVCGADQWSVDGDPLHDRIHRTNPEAAVIYAEPEPVIYSHALGVYDTATNARSSTVRVVQADIYDPGFLRELYEQPNLPMYPGEPVAVLHCATLPFAPAATGRTNADITAGLIDTLPEGSFLALTHLCAPEEPDRAKAAHQAGEELAARGLGTRPFLPGKDIEALFDGLSLVVPNALTHSREPVPCPEWYPPGPFRERYAIDQFNLAGLAHKGKPWPYA